MDERVLSAELHTGPPVNIGLALRRKARVMRNREVVYRCLKCRAMMIYDGPVQI